MNENENAADQAVNMVCVIVDGKAVPYGTMGAVGGIVPDDYLDEISENSVQNKVITAKLNEMQETINYLAGMIFSNKVVMGLTTDGVTPVLTADGKTIGASWTITAARTTQEG